MSLSRKEIKKETNDSTFTASEIQYQEDDGSWKTVQAKIRVRGNYRLNNCYFPPLKLKFSKSDRKGTLFKGNKKLKMVLPCNAINTGDDYVVNEYLAYKLYEIVTPYHLKTRLLEVNFEDLKGKKAKSYDVKGIFIEDIEELADRVDGKVFERPMHPQNQGALTSVQNAFFQFMIGNTDYSTMGQHNEKLLYVDKTFVPVPYDFDMSGLVNTNYSVVSVINGESLPIESVKERLYRGFERDPRIIAQVRQEYLNNEARFFDVLNSIKDNFDQQRTYIESREYLTSFFEILKDDILFDKKIKQKLRPF